jgi:hypothetical protein
VAAERVRGALLCVPAASAQAIAGLSDVPAAAMVAATAAVALTTETGRVRWGALAALAALTVLTKPSVLAPLGGLAIAVLLAEDGVDGIRVRDGGSARARATLAPLAVGIGIGLFAHLLAARRLGVGLYEYLTTGSGGYWAERAAEERWDAALRLEVLGPALRLPLAFILVYALLRLVRRTHRASAIVALGLAMTWTVVGGVVAGEGETPLWSPEAVFAWIGFLALLVGFVAVPSELAPTRARVVQLALVGVPPLLVWWYATPYADRLAATSWPGLCALVAVTLAVPIAALARTAGIAALAPALVLLVAVWVSLSSLDGFGADQWREYRSLGRGGIRDENRTLNIVLPAVQAANELIRPAMGSGGRLSTSDPRFSYWFPDRVSVGYITQCAQLEGFSAFILLTSDESRAQLEAEGGSGEPGWWADCEQPRLRQVSDGENGFAVFLIED